MIDYPEGATPLDPDEIECLKHKYVTTRAELDHLEQANIQSVLLWMKKSRKKDILNDLNHSAFFQLCKMLLISIYLASERKHIVVNEVVPSELVLARARIQVAFPSDEYPPMPTTAGTGSTTAGMTVN